MLLFWILSLTLVAMVLFVIIRPVTRERNGEADIDDSLRIRLYRENLAEIESDFTRGEVNEEQLNNVKSETELSLLREAGQYTGMSQASDGSSDSPDRTLLSLLVIMIGGLSLILYYYIGNPQLITLKQISGRATAEAPLDDTSLEEVVPLLERHLQRNPGDANGLYFLGSTYAARSDYSGAVSAYRRLYELASDNTQVMLAYADALVRANDGRFDGLPSELVEKVIALEPQNYTARLFAGLAAEERDELVVANEHYRVLLPVLRDRPQLLQTINMLIERNSTLMGESGQEENTGDAVASASIILDVSLSEELASRASPDDIVFVYAQATDGPPMPLAVVRRQVSELPLRVTLDDSMAMMPSRKLSDFETVKIQARVSSSGNAQVTSGDLLGVNESVSVSGDDSVKIEINEVVP